MADAQIIPFKKRYGLVKTHLSDPSFLKAIKDALPRHISEDKMIRVVLTALTKNPELTKCTIASLLRSVLEASQLGLMVDGILGQGYLVPFRNKKTGELECTFIAGYKGLIQLARNSGQVNFIDAHCVYDGDDFDFAYGCEPFLRHKPAEMMNKKRGKKWAVYAVAKLKTGETPFVVMFKDDVEAIRARSKAATSGPWVTDEDEMWKKTADRRLCKTLPLSAEAQIAVTKAEYEEKGLLDNVDLGTLDLSLSEEPEEPEEFKPALEKLTQDLSGPRITIDVEAQREIDDEGDVKASASLEETSTEWPPEAPRTAPEPGPVPPDLEGVEEVTQAKKGPITENEEDDFMIALDTLRSRAEEVMSARMVKDVMDAMLHNAGAEKGDPLTIRSRAKREDLIIRLDQWIVQTKARMTEDA